MDGGPNFGPRPGPQKYALARPSPGAGGLEQSPEPASILILIQREFCIKLPVWYTINDLPVGRRVDETLCLVQAFQFIDKHGEACLAN
uniref:Uncharacterized protein n=1 Tax=Panagrolaimus davidi TaxID=227884 RepID=A0A914PMG7_9BILA